MNKAVVEDEDVLGLDVVIGVHVREGAANLKKEFNGYAGDDCRRELLKRES